MFNFFITQQDERILNNLQKTKKTLERCIDKVDKINNKLDEIIKRKEGK